MDYASEGEIEIEREEGRNRETEQKERQGSVRELKVIQVIDWIKRVRVRLRPRSRVR